MGRAGPRAAACSTALHCTAQVRKEQGCPGQMHCLALPTATKVRSSSLRGDSFGCRHLLDSRCPCSGYRLMGNGSLSTTAKLEHPSRCGLCTHALQKPPGGGTSRLLVMEEKHPSLPGSAFGFQLLPGGSNTPPCGSAVEDAIWLASFPVLIDCKDKHFVT